jgi:hypothetical protein
MRTPRPPSEASLRRAELLWGKPQEPLGAPQPIVASSLKMINKGTLVAYVDLTFSKWRFTIRGCAWHRKEDREWVNLSTREWSGADGQRKFFKVCEFVNHGDARRFQEVALEAIHRLVPEAGR